jgi:uncharacterized membrane protein (UPF0127 family)
MKRTKRPPRALLPALTFALAIWAAPAARAAGTTELTAGIHLITAEVARSEAERSRGLMHRELLPENHGMVFLFDGPGLHCMWMRNTPIALAVAFLEDDGTIANIEEMAPRTDATHCAARPVRYALEMPGGWFGRKAIHAGHAIRGLPVR